MLFAASMVLALVAGALGGFLAARAEHWELIRRLTTIDGFLRASAARQGKVAQAEAKLAPRLPRPEEMTELEILHEAAARGMLHTQQPRRSGE